MIFRSFLTHHCTDIETIHFCNRKKGPTENSIWILYSWQLLFCDNSFNILHHHLFSGFTDFIDFLAAWCFGVGSSIFQMQPHQLSLKLPQCRTNMNVRNTIFRFGESWITFTEKVCLYTEYCSFVFMIWAILTLEKTLCSCHDLKKLKPQANSGLP